jgi:hypothetical protein
MPAAAPRVYKRFELIRIVDRFQFGQHRSDISLPDFNMPVMPAATDSEICKARHLHEPNLNANTGGQGARDSRLVLFRAALTGRSWPGEVQSDITNKFFQSVGLKVEADGDIHIALEDATGNAVGTISAEIPVGSKWCEIRQTVFGWTMQGFPFTLKTAKKLKLRETHVITVTGKAFYDVAHAPANHSNRRNTPKEYAVWEIHPVMRMEVIQ